MQVLVERIVSQKNFGIIFAGRVLDGDLISANVQVKATSKIMLGVPGTGEIWYVDGPLIKTKWGDQITADLCWRLRPTGKLIIEFLANYCPGVGRVRSQALWDHFGLDLPDILTKGDLSQIAPVIASGPVLGIRLAYFVVKAWRAAEADAALAAWFQKHGLGDLRAMRLAAKVFGLQAVKRLQDNPWCLASILPWPQVDEIGLKVLAELGVKHPERSAKRLLGAFDSAMSDVLAEGHTQVSGPDLERILERKIKSHDLAPSAIHTGHAAGAAVERDGSYLPPGSAFMENFVVRKLHQLCSGDWATGRDTPRSDTLKCVLDELVSKQIKLDVEQEQACLRALLADLSLLVGGAGTGKTTVIRYITRAWHRLGGNVLMATLSGKAALRLSQSTGMLAKTLCRVIGELEERAAADSRSKNSLAKIDAKTLVVIDEASMVDLATFYKLMKHLVPGAKLLLAGDPAQLPPIGFGLIFHRLVADDAITSRLTTIHRQTEASGIPAVAAGIRNRQMPELKEYAGKIEGVSFIDAPPDQIPGVIESVTNDLGGFDGRSELLVVTATNQGPAGAVSLNRHFHNLYSAKTKHFEKKGHLGQYFCPGEPVIHLRNDYQRGIFNGSMGWVMSLDMKAWSLTAVLDGRDVTFNESQLIDLALAYAVTCHKCQGSQVKRVVVPIYRTKLLDPSWLYTAVTRAEKQVVLVGDRKEFEKALERPFAAETRRVGFKWINRKTNFPLETPSPTNGSLVD